MGGRERERERERANGLTQRRGDGYQEVMFKEALDDAGIKVISSDPPPSTPTVLESLHSQCEAIATLVCCVR